MSIQKKPSIRVLPSRKKQTISGVEITFEINKSIHSIDLKEIYFTNFIKKDKIKFKFVKDEINRIKRNDINTESYKIKEENYSKKNKLRIEKIFHETYDANNTRPLIRIKHITSKEFQLFCQEQNGKYIIQLIDLHHLIVPAADKDHGEIVANPEKKYNDVKGGKINLKDLI